MSERRWQAILVSEHDMLDVLRGTVRLSMERLPDDAEIARVAHDWSRRGFILAIWSASFPIVPEGMETPFRDPPLAQVTEVR